VSINTLFIAQLAAAAAAHFMPPTCCAFYVGIFASIAVVGVHRRGRVCSASVLLCWRVQNCCVQRKRIKVCLVRMCVGWRYSKQSRCAPRAFATSAPLPAQKLNNFMSVLTVRLAVSGRRCRTWNIRRAKLPHFERYEAENRRLWLYEKSNKS